MASVCQRQRQRPKSAHSLHSIVWSVAFIFVGFLEFEDFPPHDVHEFRQRVHPGPVHFLYRSDSGGMHSQCYQHECYSYCVECLHDWLFFNSILGGVAVPEGDVDIPPPLLEADLIIIVTPVTFHYLVIPKIDTLLFGAGFRSDTYSILL